MGREGPHLFPGGPSYFRELKTQSPALEWKAVNRGWDGNMVSFHPTTSGGNRPEVFLSIFIAAAP